MCVTRQTSIHNGQLILDEIGGVGYTLSVLLTKDRHREPQSVVKQWKCGVRRTLLLPVEYEKWDLGAKIKSPEAQNKSYLFCTRLKEIQKLARGYNLHAIRIISTFSEAFSSCAYKMTCSYFDVSITADVCLRTVLGRRRGRGRTTTAGHGLL